MRTLMFCTLFCFLLTYALFSKNCNEEDRGSKATASFNQVKELGLAVDVPGSCPPRCTYKCGECAPCLPVLMPVPPGTALVKEYYPESWLCQCGKKFFVP